jgi:hypothetical protein
VGLLCLTDGAVVVAAGVVFCFGLSTVIALSDFAAHGWSSAVQYRVHRFPLLLG